MLVDSLVGHVRRGVVAVVGVLVLLVGPLAPPAQAQDYDGSFTAAYADPASVSLDQWSGVHFVVSAPMQSTGAYVVIRDAQGASVVTCNSGTECVYTFNPLPGVTHTFSADLFAPRNGSSVVIATAGPVTVTDTGWAGDFTHAYAENPTPVLDASTLVKFGVSAPLSSAILDVRDEKGALVASCNRGNECDVPVNPSPGETKTYTASLRVLLAGQWVERASRSVTVKDPGWQGTIAAAPTNKTFVKPGSTAWLTFVTTSPRSMATVEMYVDGVLKTSCWAPGGDLSCTIDLPMGVDEIRTVTANVVPHLVEGWATPRATTTQVVTSMTEESFSNFLLTAPAPVLQAKLGTELGARAALLQQQTKGPSFCLALGQSFPSYRLRMTIPDLTAVCVAGQGAALAILLKEFGIDGLLSMAQNAADDPRNYDPLDPDHPAGGGVGTDENPCYHYDFDGNCIDGLEADPEPELQAAADGARVPPPGNCMDDAARNKWLTETPVETHHIITQFENQAQPGAGDVQIEKSVDVDALQTIAAWYGLNWADGQWNLISMPHKGPHPPAYHKWLLDQVRAIDAVTQGDTVAFLGLWDLLVRDTIAADPSIVGYDYWRCRG